jgi:hypothetical protein
MITPYSITSLAGYIFFYVGVFLVLTALFKRPALPASGNRPEINLVRLGAGLLIFATGGLLQVSAEFIWGFLSMYRKL